MHAYIQVDSALEKARKLSSGRLPIGNSNSGWKFGWRTGGNACCRCKYSIDDTSNVADPADGQLSRHDEGLPFGGVAHLAILEVIVARRDVPLLEDKVTAYCHVRVASARAMAAKAPETMLHNPLSMLCYHNFGTLQGLPWSLSNQSAALVSCKQGEWFALAGSPFGN